MGNLNRNILITAIGGDIACAALRCIIRSNAYYYIIGCDITKYVQGIMYVNEFVLAPEYKNVSDYLAFIRMVCQEKKITHFLPMTEAEITLADKNREFFQEHNIKLMINNELIINIATSKYKTAHFLAEHHILAPKTYYPSDDKKQLEFPLILKPDASCGSKNIHVVHDNEELQVALLKADNFVIQEYIGSSDEEYTVGIFSDGTHIRSVAFKRKLGFGGMSVFVETIEDPEIDKIAERVAESFDLVGSINIQMRKADNKYYIFEINPRISSTVGFRDKFGFHDVIWWLNMLDDVENNLDYKTIGGKIGIKTLDEMALS